MTSEIEEAVARDIAGETLHGFRVAAWRETHPEHGDKYGHIYSEHWSTPNNSNPAVKVERLFTEDQLRTILSALAASQAEVERLTRERDEALREMGRYAAEAGEAKGRLEMSEAAGIVDMWREHAQAAEARATRAEALVEEAGEVLGWAEQWFSDYERQHRAKGTPDADAKADTNRDRANYFRAFLDKLKGEG